VLITGAGGYIGGRLTEAFLERGWSVRALVREAAPWLAVEQHVFDLALDDTDHRLAGLLRGVDAVVHLAGENEVTASRSPAMALSATVVATERLAEACVRAGVARLLYMSTVHVYGDRIRPGVTLTEDMRPEPRAAYGISRLASEHVAASLADGAYELVVLRLTNTVGAPYDPRVDRWTIVANDLCRQGALGNKLELRSSGVQWRDFVPLRDVCGALTAASEPAGRLTSGTYNLASGHPLTVRELASMVQASFERQTGTRPELRAPEPSGERPAPYHVSVRRATERGLKLSEPLQDAVDETVRFCLEHRDRLR
jgi:UDP-glucose 4-epimerase